MASWRSRGRKRLVRFQWRHDGCLRLAGLEALRGTRDGCSSSDHFGHTGTKPDYVSLANERRSERNPMANVPEKCDRNLDLSGLNLQGCSPLLLPTCSLEEEHMIRMPHHRLGTTHGIPSPGIITSCFMMILSLSEPHAPGPVSFIHSAAGPARSVWRSGYGPGNAQLLNALN